MTRQTPVRYPSQTRARMKYEMIIQTTAELIDNLGYAKVSPVDVCKATGYAIGTFYSYFADIHHVIDIIQTRHVDMFAQAYETHVRSYEVHLDAHPGQADPATRLPDMLALILPAMDEVASQPGWSSLPFRTVQASWQVSLLVARVCPDVYDEASDLLIRVALTTTASLVRLTEVFPSQREGMFELQEQTLRGLGS